MISPLLTANLLATGCSLLLIKRGPTRRLRLLSLTVGLMALSQSAVLLESAGICATGGPAATDIHQTLTGALSLLAIYLLGLEIYDRNVTDRRLRLAEFDAMKSKPDKSQVASITGSHEAALQPKS
jgi:hypothetical protein